MGTDPNNAESAPLVKFQQLNSKLIQFRAEYKALLLADLKGDNVYEGMTKALAIFSSTLETSRQAPVKHPRDDVSEYVLHFVDSPFAICLVRWASPVSSGVIAARIKSGI